MRALAQEREERPCRAGGTDDVDVEHPSPLVISETLCGAEELHTNVRHHHVRSAEPLRDCGRRRVDRFGVSDIDTQAQRFDA